MRGESPRRVRASHPPARGLSLLRARRQQWQRITNCNKENNQLQQPEDGAALEGAQPSPVIANQEKNVEASSNTNDIVPTQSQERIEFFSLVKTVINDPHLKFEEKKSLIGELRKTAPVSDRWTFRPAIWILGSVSFLSVIAISILSMNKIEINAGLVSLASMALGGIAGLLTPV